MGSISHPHLGYLPITRRMWPHDGQWVKRGCPAGWLVTIVVWGLRSGGVTWDEVLVCLLVPGPKCGSWNLPRFLLSEGWLILMYMASLMFFVMPWDSLPTMQKQSGLIGCPVVVVWRWMGDGALRCSLYLSPSVLPDSPMYFSVQLICGHLYFK